MNETHRASFHHRAIAALVASSHREAPGISEPPKIDGADFYMVRSYEPGRADFVTFIANYQPIQPPYGGPNYFTMDPDAIYEIHIDNDGDAIEDQTYQFNFTNELVNGTGQILTIEGVELPVTLRALGPIGGDNGDDFRADSETFTITKINGDRRTGGAERHHQRRRRVRRIRQADRQYWPEDDPELPELRRGLHLRCRHPRLSDAGPRLRRPARRGLRGQSRRGLRSCEPDPDRG